MIKIETVRKVSKAVIGASVWWTIGNMIDNNVTPETRRQKLEVMIGSAAIGWVVTEQASLYIDRKFDSVVAKWNKATKKTETETDLEPQDIVQDVPL